MAGCHVRVDHHRHRSLGDDPEEGGGIVGSVRHGHHDTFARGYLGETVDVVTGERRHLPVSPGLVVGVDRIPVTVSLCEPLEQKEIDQVPGPV